MEDYSRYEQEIVRLFYDYTDAVLWFPDPVPYDEARLSPVLTEALRTWGRRHEDGLAANQEWSSPELAAQLAAELPELAKRVGDELGWAFEVEYSGSTADPMDGPRKVRYRSSRRAKNADASAAFEARASAAREAALARTRRPQTDPDESIVLATRDPTSGGWFAYQPRSGEIYRPPSP